MEGCISNQIIKHSSWPPKLCKKTAEVSYWGTRGEATQVLVPVTSALAPCSPAPAWCPLGCRGDAGAVRLVRCPGVGSSSGAGAGCALHERVLGSRRRRKEEQAERWREDCRSREWPWCSLSILEVLRHCPPALGVGGDPQGQEHSEGLMLAAAACARGCFAAMCLTANPQPQRPPRLLPCRPLPAQ